MSGDRLDECSSVREPIVLFTNLRDIIDEKSPQPKKNCPNNFFSFSITHLFFAKHFGYMVLANVRGGGEYGDAWHNSGRLLNQQNTFDDFHAAAEYLVSTVNSRNKSGI